MFDLHETGNIVEHNLLVNCSGEAEIISVKSSKNTIRYNTIRNSTGNLTLRAGKNNLVYGNFVFGTGNQGGLRIFDDRPQDLEQLRPDRIGADRQPLRPHPRRRRHGGRSSTTPSSAA